jgi:amidase
VPSPPKEDDVGLGEELTWADATAQAQLVAKGEVSALELCDAAIERIEAVNPQLNAVIHRLYDKARRAAAGELPDGPFTGVPFLIKDLVCTTAGDPYHGGSALLRDAGYIADHDTYLAEKFKRAGFVVVGRTNTPELGSTITTEPVAYGPCRNPWNTDHSTGGSSGGSAAAVAAGLVPAAHANDGGGSIRIPASECGLVGLKPSRGRVTQGPDVGETWMGSTIEHAVTRSVRDSAAILDAIAGYVPGDPYTAPPPSASFLSAVGAPLAPLRIGLLDHPAIEGFAGHRECELAVARAGRLLESLGHFVTEAHPAALGEAEFQTQFNTIVAAAAAREMDVWSAKLGHTVDPDGLEPGNAMFVTMGRGISAPDYLAAVDWLHAYGRRMATWWQDFDILVSPVIAAPPPPIGWLTDESEGLQRVIALLQYTAQFNVTGQPAVSLPLHMTADGLPVGVQFVAAYGQEELLISLAATLEDAAPWAELHPPVHA